MWPEAQRPSLAAYPAAHLQPGQRLYPRLSCVFPAPLHTLQPFLGAPGREPSFPPRPSPPRRPRGAAQAHGGSDCFPSGGLSLIPPITLYANSISKSVFESKCKGGRRGLEMKTYQLSLCRGVEKEFGSRTQKGQGC